MLWFGRALPKSPAGAVVLVLAGMCAAAAQMPPALKAAASMKPADSAHVALVQEAQQAAYAISRAINGCPAPETDIQGWPAASLRDCIFLGDKPPKGKQLKGRVILLKVDANAIARWIETACATLLPNVKGCFEAVLVCGKYNSGMMFPVSGNLLENPNGPRENYFTRHGMVVGFKGQPNGTRAPVKDDRQNELIFASADQIDHIKTGLTRFWRTLPRQFAERYPKSGAPKLLDEPNDRTKWLEVAKTEFSKATTHETNRLLEAWIAAHPKTITSIAALGIKLRAMKKELAQTDCPEEDSP